MEELFVLSQPLFVADGGPSACQSQIDANSKRTQLCLVAADSAAGRKGWRSQTKGGKQEANGGKLAFIRAVQAFTCHGGRVARATPSFIQAAFTSHAAFFVSFPVRPALLPYGKRGFRAAICKIARPQSPAAALWLQERIVPSCVPFLPPFPSSFTPC